jgi:hypothetical protein
VPVTVAEHVLVCAVVIEVGEQETLTEVTVEDWAGGALLLPPPPPHPPIIIAPREKRTDKTLRPMRASSYAKCLRGSYWRAMVAQDELP